ncbi:transposase family protein [Micromonospora sp. NPDC048830]|uniref:transposase family protein n=1 Tax=Micromonospora sp. NPDC048830 TaxID=3364257 RepID=UPI00372407B2
MNVHTPFIVYKERPFVSVSHAAFDAVTVPTGEVDTRQVAVLAALFGQVNDPRTARGVRHPLATVLTVLALALLCGARNFRLYGANTCRTCSELGLHGNKAPSWSWSSS